MRFCWYLGRDGTRYRPNLRSVVSQVPLPGRRSAAGIAEGIRSRSTGWPSTSWCGILGAERVESKVYFARGDRLRGAEGHLSRGLSPLSPVDQTVIDGLIALDHVESEDAEGIGRQEWVMAGQIRTKYDRTVLLVGYPSAELGSAASERHLVTSSMRSWTDRRRAVPNAAQVD